MLRQCQFGIIALAGFTIAVSAQACDPQAAAMRVFTDQGLNLIRPARSYITIGGLVVKPSRGRPEYLDPFDEAPTQAGTVTDFKAMVLGETRSRTVDVGVALKALGTIIPAALQVTPRSSTQVTLSQIDASGTRLVVPALRRFIRSAATRAEIEAQLQAGHRVFVIQEVYTAAALELTASVARGLEVSLGGSDVEACAPGSSGTHATSPEAQKVADAAVASADPGVGLGLCVDNRTVLKMKTTSALPILVRLAEVENRSGALGIKLGTERFRESLGSADVEQATAMFAADAVVPDLVRRPGLTRKPGQAR